MRRLDAESARAVAQWFAKDPVAAPAAFDIEVGNYQVFLELFTPRYKLSLLIQYYAVAIEDQLILSSHQVVVGNDGYIV